jgi:anti-sigma regulatory factor (Ser/Thr protein kinase)
VEAVNNSIEHAYQLADGGEVQVVINCDGVVLQVEVRDGGRPMPATALAAPRRPTSTSPARSCPRGAWACTWSSA